MMAKPIYFVGGGKGGVGKSLLAMALIDHLQRKKIGTVLVETDTSAPDVWKHYKDEVRNTRVDLDRKEGWIDLLDFCADAGDDAIVINTKAANQTGIRKFGTLIMESLEELRRELVVFWVIDRKREGLELLAEFRETSPKVKLHVVRNNHWGGPDEFSTYNGSDLKTAIEKAGGRSLDFPDLAERVTEAMNTERLSLGKASDALSFGNRVELTRWRMECSDMLAEVTGE